MTTNKVVGSRFYTRISTDNSVLVEVVGDKGRGTKRYRVKRCDTNAVLSRLRGAGELHGVPGPWARYASGERPNPMSLAKLAVIVKPIVAPGLAKTATMSKAARSELLRQLAAMPEDTLKALGKLINSVSPSNTVSRVREEQVRQ